jgi:PTH1 family peptidyl-tRNA hydrolase
MYLVVALGNKGEEYKVTRHNVGWLLVDEMLGDVSWYTNKAKTLDHHKQAIKGSDVSFIKPLTMMNNSGDIVRAVMKKYPEIEKEQVIVLHDDIDIPSGALRVSYGKGDANHNGVASIIQRVGTKNIIRIRIGVGNPGRVPMRKYVLGKLSTEELEALEKTGNLLHKILEVIITEGVSKAMNDFNTRS